MRIGTSTGIGSLLTLYVCKRWGVCTILELPTCRPGRVAPKLAGPSGHHLTHVAAGQPARVVKHLMRANKIQSLEPLENDEHDPLPLHPSTLTPVQR